MRLRDADEGDGDFILALNVACTPHVGDLDAAQLRDLVRAAYRILIAEDETGPCGFLVLLRPGARYDSDNYAWFEQRFARHLYIDRIAVAGSARRAGAGRALYDAALALARDLGEQRLTAEVNEDPPNPASLAFHERMGFARLDSRPSRSGKVVAMLERPLDKT